MTKFIFLTIVLSITTVEYGLGQTKLDSSSQSKWFWEGSASFGYAWMDNNLDATFEQGDSVYSINQSTNRGSAASFDMILAWRFPSKDTAFAYIAPITLGIGSHSLNLSSGFLSESFFRYGIGFGYDAESVFNTSTDKYYKRSRVDLRVFQDFITSSVISNNRYAIDGRAYMGTLGASIDLYHTWYNKESGRSFNIGFRIIGNGVNCLVCEREAYGGQLPQVTSFQLITKIIK